MVKLLDKKEAKNFVSDYAANNHLYAMLDDGYLIEFDIPRIDKTMYYNDEYEAPSTKYESWSYHNIFYNFNNQYAKWLEEKKRFEETGCSTGRYNYNGGAIFHQYYDNNICFVSLEYDAKNDWRLSKLYVRDLSLEEVYQLCEIENQLLEAYKKRLATYYKKYSDKITTCGYWANR